MKHRKTRRFASRWLEDARFRARSRTYPDNATRSAPPERSACGCAWGIGAQYLDQDRETLRNLARGVASIRRRSRTCAVAHTSENRRAAARRHCRCRCRPRPAFDTMSCRAVHFLHELLSVDRLPFFALHEKIGQRFVARQAADVGGENPVAAEDHDWDSGGQFARFIAQSRSLGSMFGSPVATKFR